MALPLITTQERTCSYLPDRMARTRAFWAEGLSGELYQNLMDAGFRRSGRVVYQPVCRGCRACLPIRVLVRDFKSTKAQRRCLRRNQDVNVRWGRPKVSEEKLALYQRYQVQWHGQAEVSDREELEAFLYDSPLDSTLEFEYRDQRAQLLGVGICDVCSKSLSSVYFYFDPDHSRRGLGTYAALYEINFAVEHGLPYYYLGYWVKDCTAMNYKSTYRPNEVLGTDGVWRRLSD